MTKSRSVKSKTARTEAYALVFGKARTASPALRGELPEYQGRTPDPYSADGFKSAGKQLVKLFETAEFSPRREKELVAYFNRRKPAGVGPLQYEPVVEDEIETEAA